MSAIAPMPGALAVPRPATRVRLRLNGWHVGALVTLAWIAASLLVQPFSSHTFVWVTGVGFAAASVLPFVIREGGLDAGNVFPLFTLYYSMSLLLRGIGVLTFTDSPYLRDIGDGGTDHVRMLVGWMNLYSALGLLAAFAAFHSPWAKRQAVRITQQLPMLSAPWRANRVTPVVVCLMTLGISAAMSRMKTAGGFMGAAANPMMTGGEGALGYWWLIALTEFAVVGFHIHMIRLLMRNDKHFLAHYLILGLGLSMPIYLFSSSKFLLLRTLFLPWLFRHFLVKRIALVKLLLGFAFFAALFPFFYAYRALGLLNLSAFDLYWQNHDAPLLLLFNRAYGADSFMLILHRTGTELPFQWGKSLLDLFTFWIPRLLWPGKPDSFGLVFPTQYMPDVHWGAMTYVSASLPGELYLNWHVPGVIIGCALLGIFMRVGYGMARRGPGALLLYGYIFLTCMHIVEGIIASQFETLLTHIVPCTLALLWLTRGGRHTRPGADAVPGDYTRPAAASSGHVE